MTRPATPEEIDQILRQHEAAELAVERGWATVPDFDHGVARRIRRKANALGAYRSLASDPMAPTPIVEERRPSGRYLAGYGGGLFCRLKCAEAFARAAYHAGYRLKGAPRGR